MNSRARAFQKKMEDLLASVGRLEDAEVDRVLALLEASRIEIASRVAQTDWQAYMLPQLKEAATRAIANFGNAYLSSHNAALANMHESGIDMVDWPLREAGIGAMVPEISRTSLEILQGYSADLIGGLTADVAKKINGELAMGLLGSKTPFEVMQAIGLSLDDKGAFSSIASRAEAITRTEMAAVQSLAREARLRNTVAANPDIGWKKKWIASGKAHPRPNHARVHNEEAAVDKKFSNGILYPHAPGLPAKETVRCGCSHVLVADWDALPKQFEKVTYQPRAIYDGFIR